MMRKCSTLIIPVVLLVLFLFVGSAAAYSLPGSGDFNGMSINYSISGGSVDENKFSDGFTQKNTITGTCSPGTVTISGTAIAHREIETVVISASINNGSKSDTYNYTIKHEKTSKSFSISIPVTKSTDSVSFSISMNGHYGNGESRGLLVSGKLKNTGAVSGSSSSSSDGGSSDDGGFPVVPVVIGGVAVAGAAGATAGIAVHRGKGGSSSVQNSSSGRKSSGAKPSSSSSKWISIDRGGSLTVTDPVTGEKRHYFPHTENGTTTYKNPLTDAEYTLEELEDSLASREENAGVLKQDAETAKKAVTDQRAHANEESEFSRESRKVLKEKETELAHQDYVDKVHEKYNTTNDKEIRKEQIQDYIKNANNADRWMQRETELAAAQTTAENIETVADVSIDTLAEFTGEAGKTVKDGYTMTKSVASRVSEAHAYGKDMGVAVSQGVAEGAIGVIQNRVDSGVSGAAAAGAGDSVKAGLDAYINGKDVSTAMKDGAVSGTVNYTVSKGVEFVDNATIGNDLVTNFDKAYVKKDITDPIFNDIADANQVSASNEKELAEIRRKIEQMKAAKK